MSQQCHSSHSRQTRWREKRAHLEHDGLELSSGEVDGSGVASRARSDDDNLGVLPGRLLTLAGDSELDLSRARAVGLGDRDGGHLVVGGGGEGGVVLGKGGRRGGGRGSRGGRAERAGKGGGGGTECRCAEQEGCGAREGSAERRQLGVSWVVGGQEGEGDGLSSCRQGPPDPVGRVLKRRLLLTRD